VHKEERSPTRYEIGLDQWRDGRLQEAADTLREVIRNTELELSEYRGALGGVLSALGQDDEALGEYQEALRLTLAEYRDDAASPVAVSRYFLGEQLLKMHRAEEALATVNPSLATAVTRPEPLLRLIEAEALWRLGQREGAIKSAKRAIETSAPGTQRDRIQDRLHAMLSAEGRV
jgi:tetratricopeptide (TPR) repeat protein